MTKNAKESGSEGVGGIISGELEVGDLSSVPTGVLVGSSERQQSSQARLVGLSLLLALVQVLLVLLSERSHAAGEKGRVSVCRRDSRRALTIGRATT